MFEASSPRMQHWQRHIACYHKSGLTRREYCERHELKVGTFDYWRRRLRLDDTGAPAPAVSVVRVDLEPVALPQPSSLEIVLGNGRRIRVANDFEPATLARVVTTLEQLS